MDNLASWAEEALKSPGFRAFMKKISDRCDVAAKLALQKGETEYLKGSHFAYNWVKNLPQQLIKDGTATDTD